MHALSSVLPAPENDSLYRPVTSTDPEIHELALSISRHGVREPLVLSRDGYLLSGHRRRVAAERAGLSEVPVRYEPVARILPDGSINPEFVVLLREHNRQREKSLDEKLREEIVTASPDVAYQSLIAHRRARSAVDVDTIKLRGRSRRSRITKAKKPFLGAIKRVIKDQARFLPLSDRRIHYALLNDPPLRHASKPDSRYRNDKESYKSLVELLTRARLAGEIPMNAIADDTRPSTTWKVHADPRSFVREELDGMFTNYWRDLQRSQPNHIEILVEKNTVEPIVRPVAEKYCIPITSGRGFCSLPPRAAMAERYGESGKDQLVILIVSDFDPDGEEIAHSFARSMRDDFGIASIVPVKVALNHKQVAEFELHPNLQAKETSSRYQSFVDQYGTDVFELEALSPDALQSVVHEAIDSVIDTDAFNAELDAEKSDAAWLHDQRQRMHLALRGAT